MAVRLLFLVNVTIDTTQFLKNFFRNCETPNEVHSHASLMEPDAVTMTGCGGCLREGILSQSSFLLPLGGRR